MKKLLLNPWLTRASELVLGGVFLYAPYHKIVDPPDFAHMIYNYRLTPGSLINLLAIYLPWIEGAVGAALVLRACGLLRWRGCGANLLVGLLLCMFIGAIGINLARGHAIDCGCFEGTGGVHKPHEVLLGEMWIVVARDLGMLLLAAQALHARSRAEPAGAAAASPASA